MRFTLLAALLLPISALAGTLNLETGYYWQVQNAITYETVCEGHITVCNTTDDSRYIVINHDTGAREENVIATNQAAIPRPTVKVEICKIDYEYLEQASYDGFPVTRCTVTCPPGKIVIGAEASGEYGDYRNDGADIDFSSEGLGTNSVTMLFNGTLDESTFTADAEVSEENAYRVYATAVCF